MIRIIAVDDHTLLREALCEVLRAEPDFEVVAQTATADGLAELAARYRPDVILLDVEMPGHVPESTVRDLAARFPCLQVLILSMHDDISLVQELLRSGARGFLHKSVPREQLLSAIRTVARDQAGASLVVSGTGLTMAGGASAGPGPLSARELELLSLVAEAMSNRQIANRLGITEGTVKRHLRNIFGKLGAVSRIDAVNRAVAGGLIAARTARPPSDRSPPPPSRRLFTAPGISQPRGKLPWRQVGGSWLSRWADSGRPG
jgi:DNA-binding NarL/FixJ family response regulator